MSKERVIHVAVVGVSGLESSKGGQPVGVGKSALCNRFVRPLADEYQQDVHTSIVSQYDFKDHIINSDHFLYWGDVTKEIDDGHVIDFSIIEQTEFLDDRSFAPLKGSNTQPYHKRCAVTKLTSKEKLMYVKSYHETGDEEGYERKMLPGGKFAVDGYIMVFDVSRAAKQADNQLAFLQNLQKTLAKTKKPIVVVPTKCDEANDRCLGEAQAFASNIQSGYINYVETSAHKAINVNLAFITLAQVIDKSHGLPKTMMYTDAYRARQELIDRITDAYTQLLEKDVVDYHTLWLTKSKEYQKSSQPFSAYIKHLGMVSARKVFEKHRKKLKEDLIARKTEQHLNTLLKVLDDFFPDLSTVEHRSWEECKDMVSYHRYFHKWFVTLDEEWKQSPYLDSKESLIPYDFLDTNREECEKVFKEYVEKLSGAEDAEK